MLYFFISFLLSLFFTKLVRHIAIRYNLLDVPDHDRKRHTLPVPLLGGVGIFLAFWLVTLFLLGWRPIHGVERIANSLLAAFLGSFILLLIGIADELRPRSARLRLAFTLITLLLVALWIGGGYLEKVTNPWGGFFYLSPLLAVTLAFVWLSGMTFTTKILDGLDGLATGVVTIGALIIYFLTSTAKFYQPNVGLVALVFAGSCLGFLVFNFHPAKIFLGESGSLFVGYMLGVLAVIGGGKFATALLVMAVPILDLARVIYVRLKRRQSFLQGDREHLHFQLLDSGMSERKIVLFYYLVAFVFGASSLFLQSYQKIGALIFLLLLTVAVTWKTAKKNK